MSWADGAGMTRLPPQPPHDLDLVAASILEPKVPASATGWTPRACSLGPRPPGDHGYLTKYLNKTLPTATSWQPTRSGRTPTARWCAALRAVLADVRELAPLWHPAQEPRPGMRPGSCKGKAHRREYLGYAGRRVLVSRDWSGKSLADHRADRKNRLTENLGLSATDPGRYAWEPVAPGDCDHMPPRRVLHVVVDRMRWLQALDQARRRAVGQQPDHLSATGEAA